MNGQPASMNIAGPQTVQVNGPAGSPGFGFNPLLIGQSLGLDTDKIDPLTLASIAYGQLADKDVVEYAEGGSFSASAPAPATPPTTRMTQDLRGNLMEVPILQPGQIPPTLDRGGAPSDWLKYLGWAEGIGMSGNQPGWDPLWAPFGAAGGGNQGINVIRNAFAGSPGLMGRYDPWDVL